MKESTSIMLWMLLFLLLITFWVDLRIRGLREEFLRHCLLLERCIGQLPQDRAPTYTTDAKDGGDGTFAPWRAVSNSEPKSGLPRFIDDLVPSQEELAKALRGVDSIQNAERAARPVPPPYLSAFEGYDGLSCYAPAFPPSLARGSS